MMNGARRRKVEFIGESKERSRRFIQRKKGLIKKANELSVLCGVDCCVIISENNNKLDHVWASSIDTGLVGDLITKYREEERGPKRVYNYCVDRKRKLLASANRELPTWNSKFESMNAHELKNLACDLEIKLHHLKNRRELIKKNKRVKSLIHHSPGLSHAGNLHMNPVVAINSAVVMDQTEEVAMNSIDGCNLHMNPVPATDSLDQEIVMDRIKLAMDSIENNGTCNDDMNPMAAINSLDQPIVINSIENNDNCNLQPIAMIQLNNVDEMMPPLGDTTLTDLQQQYLYDPSHPFVNYNSGAHTEADAFSDSFLMSPAVISTDVWETCDYGLNVFDFSLSDIFPMQEEAYACGNSQPKNCVPRQSFDCPPLPPLML